MTGRAPDDGSAAFHLLRHSVLVTPERIPVKFDAALRHAAYIGGERRRFNSPI
jgi:hypothetical protein